MATEQEKVKQLFKLMGERGLYVNTNHDVFSATPQAILLAGGAGYKVQLAQEGSQSYSSPLLFATLTSLLNHGTMLITGAPGIGKTTGSEFAGHFFTGTPLDDILAAEIKGHPQLTEEKMVARYKLGKLVTSGEEEVNPRRFLESPVKIIDEVTRMPPDTISILMDVVDRGIVIYGDTLLKAKPGPLFATANYADEGTFHLTPPFLDRFDVAVMVTSPQPWDLKRIRERGDEKLNGGLSSLLEVPEGLNLDFEEIRRQIKNIPEKVEHDVPAVSAFADFVYGSLRFSEAASLDLARATKGNAWQVNQDNAKPGHFVDSPFNYTLNELSIRTARAMQRYARAFAWFKGKDRVELDDLKSVLPYLLWHKVQPTQKAITENPEYANDRIAFVNGLTERIETDYEEMRGSDAVQYYASATRAIRDGKVGDVSVPNDRIRGLVVKAIEKIGAVDKTYAISLANQLASEYNERVNGSK